MTDSLDAIRRHRGTALGIARGFMRKLPRHIPREDLEQAALLGLWDWKRRHPDEDTPGWFGGMRQRVRGSIIDELRHQDWLPRYTRRDHGHLHVVGFDDVDTSWDLHYAAHGAPADQLLEVKEQIQEAMQAPISERDHKVIDMHYFRGQKFKDIGARLGVSEPRISQLHSRTIGKMRDHLERAEQTGLRPLKETHVDDEVPSGIYPKGTPAVISTLPYDGVDLRAELQRYQDWMVEQALIRTGGNKAQAAKLLGLERTCLVMMLKQRGPIRPAPAVTEEAATDNAGMVRVSRADIARLKAEGKNAAQIGSALGVSRWLIERELKRPAPLAKCGPKEEQG